MRRMALVIALCSTLTLFAQSSGGYHFVQTYELGGDGAWDYVVPQPSQHRVFVARTNRVMVIDEDNGKFLGEVMGINGAHGTAIDEARLTDEVAEGKVTEPYFRRSIVWLTGSRVVGTIAAQFLLIPAAFSIVAIAEWL